MRVFVLLTCIIMVFVLPQDVWGQAGGVCVPASVMLHSHDRSFLINELIPWLLTNGYETVTYHDLALALRGELELPQKAIILSIDDLDTVGINGYFDQMVEVLHQNDMVAVLGINDTVAYADNPEPYHSLASWAALGFELATHTTDHANLTNFGPEIVAEQVVGSIERIEEGTGIRPISLILPFGAGEDDSVVFETAAQAGLEFVVGIPGTGRHLTAFNAPTYVPRVGTLGHVLVDVTWEIENWYRFNSECR